MRHLRATALTAACLVLLLVPDTASASVPAAASAPGGLRADARRDGTTYSGPGFDACSAPSLETMRAWRGNSPYGAVGVYTSGNQRACDQSRLTADWVRQVRAMGWRLIPTHVGSQAPCGDSASKPGHIDPAHAADQGRAEAAQAVTALKALGLDEGSPVYLDVEAYQQSQPSCSQAVVDFTIGWTEELHRLGYRSGFYSSLDSGIADLHAAARARRSPLPDAIWYARWDDRADTGGSGGLDEDLWVNHQRIHQNQGNVQETYGGVTLPIDRNWIDGPVAG
ncbi:DUF1906 domain-containing protein [Kitasatospora sp. MAP5-34]|uniref:DUF1906 domain-containing protein n=1 Tax=Kitasatospora sp. MAP5-34 TaxID=3035102 RepID=UPI0024761A9D|nr:DUF1906 domain-containing protein [Kitasatospora sp. MAP5-34]MDH6580560.1 hypothetical protein [Kitasatospora sp. MAP5-34]